MRSAGGLDLGSRHERDADEVASDLVERFVARAGTSDRLLVSTQPVTGDDGVHLALGVSLAPGPTPSAADAIAWSLLIEVARELALERDRPWALADAGHGVGHPDLQPTARQAANDHAARRAGRLVHFPGAPLLTGTVPVGDVLARTAIERVAVLAGEDAGPADLLVTRDFVRPRWHEGRVVLHTQPARGGTLVPFETPNPTPCCVDHV